VVEKIGTDIALMMQPEVGEAFEPAGPGRGGSSAMPHKRNPVGAMLAREAGIRAPGLVATLLAGVAGEHERGLGQWQGQWWTLGDLFGAAASGLDAMIEVIEGLEVDPAAMQRNLDATNGFVYAEALTVAVAQTLGKSAAHARVEALVHRARQDATTLQATLAADADLAALVSPESRARIFDPASQFGSADAMIDRALEAWRRREDA
jgi:3-carboxy-cis,cis-muconate cycloisomerase